MSNQEVGQTSTEEHPIEESRAAETPRPTTPLSPEQTIGQGAQRPIPPSYPPYAKQSYYPGQGPQPVYRPYYGPPYAPPPRRRSLWPWIVLAVFLVLVFTWVIGLIIGAIGINFPGYTNSVTESRSFAVTSAPTIVINNDIGSILAQSTGAGSNVTIQATKQAGLGSNVNDVQVNYDQNSSSNTITINVNRTTGSNFFNSPSVDFVVTVPGNSTLEFKTNTGGIDVSGVSGPMSLRSNTGSVSMRDGVLTSSSILQSNTGSITFNGNIGQTGSYQFMTNTGSVNVTLPASSVFHVDVTTDTGSITSDFQGVNVQHPNLTGAVAHSDVGSAPRAIVTLSTNTGSIYLHQS